MTLRYLQWTFPSSTGHLASLSTSEKQAFDDWWVLLFILLFPWSDSWWSTMPWIYLWRKKNRKYLVQKSSAGKVNIIHWLYKMKQQLSSDACAALKPVRTCSEWPHIHCCSILCPSRHSLLLGYYSQPSHTRSSQRCSRCTHSPPSHPERLVKI